MNTFKTYLKEIEEIKTLDTFVKQNCKQFWTELGTHKDVLKPHLWRGITEGGKVDTIELEVEGKVVRCFIKSVRQDRKPLDTNPEISQVIDNVFEQKFGWRPRATSVFCSGHYNGTKEYGTPYQIFPIGKFKFLWSYRVRDLMSTTLGVLGNLDMSKQSDAKFDKLELESFAQHIGDKVEEYTDKDLEEAIKSHSEIMIGCHSYLAVPYEAVQYHL